jgi:hypothetical protein
MIAQNNFIHTQIEKQGYLCVWFEVAVDTGEQYGTMSVFMDTDIEICKKWAKENITSVKEQIKKEYGTDCLLFCDSWGVNSKDDLPYPIDSIFTEGDIKEFL